MILKNEIPAKILILFFASTTEDQRVIFVPLEPSIRM